MYGFLFHLLFAKVSFVSDEKDGRSGNKRGCVLVPDGEVVERFGGCQIVNEDYSLGTIVVASCNGSESF